MSHRITDNKNEAAKGSTERFPRCPRGSGKRALEESKEVKCDMIDMSTTYSTKLDNEDKNNLLLEKVLNEVKSFWCFTTNCVADSEPTITITRNRYSVSVSVTNVGNKIIS